MNFIKKIFKKNKKEEILNAYIVRHLCPMIKDFVTKEQESGFYLPEDFKTDPASWLNVLNKIKFAFIATDNDYRGVNCGNKESDVLWEKDREEKIKEGFELFGKYLRDLR